MLRLLREKGLVGEPTLAKCKALRKKREAKREIEELDTSVILDDDGEYFVCFVLIPENFSYQK